MTAVRDVLAELLGRPAWHAQAACRGSTLDFFPARGATRDVIRAKALCASCPVRCECATFAFASGEDIGIWGGLSGRERRNARSGHPELAPDPELAQRRGAPARCGTNAGYERHLGYGEEPCVLCREARAGNDTARQVAKRPAA